MKYRYLNTYLFFQSNYCTLKIFHLESTNCKIMGHGMASGSWKTHWSPDFGEDNLLNQSLSLEKTFFPITAKIFVHLLTLFSVCKRILVLVVFFVPSFGLFRLLVHWTNEKVPFAVRQNRTISSDDILHIFGKPSVLWSEVDR